VLGCVPPYVTAELAREGRSALDLGVFMIRNTRWSRMLLDLLSHRARTSHSTEVYRTSLLFSASCTRLHGTVKAGSGLALAAGTLQEGGGW
jgi:hypothetical protein